MRSTNSLFILAVLVATTSACTAVRRTNGDSGNGNSVVASIEGMSESDRQILKDPVYLLNCGASKIEGKIDNAQNPNAIHFEMATPLSDADKQSCGLQILANAPSQDELVKFDYKWFAYPAVPDADPKRIYFASTRDSVANGALKVILYKLFSRIDRSEPAFLQPITMRFPAGEALPDAAQVSANLHCEVPEVASTNGMILSSDPTKKNEASVTFILGVDRYKGKSCQRLVIAVAGEIKFEAILKSVVLDAAAKAGTTALALGPVDLVKSTGSSISVSTSNGGDCLTFDFVASKCLDKIAAVTLPRSQNYWFALVSGKNAAGAKVEVVVTGQNGFGLDTASDHQQVSRDSIRADQALIPKGLQKFSYYQPQVRSDVLNATFDSRVVAAGYLADRKMAAADLASIKFFSVDELWVHGMNQVVDEAQFNQKLQARWLAVVKASKDTQVAEFIIAGGGDYFYSDMRRGGSGASLSYFDWDAVKRDRNSAAGVGETDYYDIFAFTGGAMLPANCVAGKEYYLDGMSAKTASDFPAPGATGSDDKLKKCEVKPLVTAYDDFKIEKTLYEWNWAEIAP